MGLGGNQITQVAAEALYCFVLFKRSKTCGVPVVKGNFLLVKLETHLIDVNLLALTCGFVCGNRLSF